MSAMEINKLVAAVLVAGLIFMAINVGVDEVLQKEPSGKTVYPVPQRGEAAAATAGQETVPVKTLAALLAEADAEKGRKIVKKCAACHDMKQGGPNKVGPNLWGIVGAGTASRQGFAYSGALAGLGGEWGYERLDAFLAGPKAFAPGTKMAFAGVKKPADRADVIAFLRTLGDNPPPLPAPE